MNVLVVEDDAITRQMLKSTLQNAGYQVTAVSNSTEAFERFLIERHQLVVSDWDMPGMDGLSLCRAIRRSECNRYVHFILLTSPDTPQNAVAGLGAGADDFVRKPVDPGELVMRVNVGSRIVNLETRGLTICAMARLAESRDADTGEHLERVRNYCRILAIQMREQGEWDEIDDDFIRLIYDTSPLHDIGKVAIPDSILLKPGKLTREEFEIMKTHTIRGAETISAMRLEFPSARFLHMAHHIILSHHEKWNGTGYPHGLAGDGIPLCARIMAIADVYDALTTVRIYKPAYTHEEAVAIIARDAGTHFDPSIVDAFMEVCGQFDSLRSRFFRSAEQSLSEDVLRRPLETIALR